MPGRSSPPLPAAGARPRSVGTGCSSRELGNLRGAAGMGGSAVATRPGPAPAPRSAGSGVRSGSPANALKAALNFLSKLLIRYTVVCSCFVQANESARLERLVTQGVVIRELQDTSPFLVWLGCTCDL